MTREPRQPRPTAFEDVKYWPWAERIEMHPIEDLPEDPAELFVPSTTIEPQVGRIALWRQASINNHAFRGLPINVHKLGLSVVERKSAKYLFDASGLSPEEIKEKVNELKMPQKQAKGKSPTQYVLSGKVDRVALLGQTDESKSGIRRVSLLFKGNAGLPGMLRAERRALIGIFGVDGFSRKERITPHVTVFKTDDHKEAVEVMKDVEEALGSQDKTVVKLGQLNVAHTKKTIKQASPIGRGRYVYKP